MGLRVGCRVVMVDWLFCVCVFDGFGWHCGVGCMMACYLLVLVGVFDLLCCGVCITVLCRLIYSCYLVVRLRLFCL